MLGRAIWILAVLAPTTLCSRPHPDPCALIAGERWALPSDVRRCLRSFPLLPEIKNNVIEVVNKTLPFHTSVNYQIQAPAPYDNDVHEDLHADLERISATEYTSEFDFHIDMYRSFKRVNDGHCGVYSRCYDSLYITYLPLPLVLLTDESGAQGVYIAPEAHEVAQKEFKDAVSFWVKLLPTVFEKKLRALSGLKVLLINGQEPFFAVEANANITGGYQSHATRQNSFFSSYRRGAEGWEYNLGNFASLAHPLVDDVELTVEYPDVEGGNVTFTLPYRSRFASASKNFTDGPSLRERNCLATNKTNGVDLYNIPLHQLSEFLEEPKPLALFQQQPAIAPSDYRERHHVNVLLDGSPLSDVSLPERLSPSLESINGSYSVAEFFMLNDSATGVLALGSFSAKNYTHFGQALLEGLQGLKKAGAERLIVDVSNNGGGYICIAHWLHRIIIGPKPSTHPQAGLDSTLRAGPLAQLIAQRIAKGNDPDELLYYNPTQWTNATHQPLPTHGNWLQQLSIVVNGKEDSFSQRLGQECVPFKWKAPKHGLFRPDQTVIVSNGRCGSSCSLFSITMAKKEGVRTVVIGGKQGVEQHYCGTVGGQSTDFSTIDTEIKSTKLKNHTLAPPDLLTNHIQGITWRLGYGIDNPNEPEEWQSHTADINFPLTKEIVNKPVAIWEAVAASVFKDKKPIFKFVVQEPL
ncbi:hypothetical protein D9611_003976 [Ephemerocybe angulata]|uniref:Tail specific protease domain-containing protein n=1 Tax=Ephemerocybe angulata TaxID=980116 RepID=A0A8H5EY38_9AGAR|nr:hypothetical protein D9611_003976 [Tulosesus angulatus]